MKSEIIKTMRNMKYGVEIKNPYLAKKIRELKKEYPALLNITEPTSRNENEPYFKAELTQVGLEYLNSIDTFDINESIKAQEEYCKNTHNPHFAPKDGVCICRRNIYSEIKWTYSITGISVQEAKTTLIIDCPHCNRSYCN